MSYKIYFYVNYLPSSFKAKVQSNLSGHGIISIIGNNKMTKHLKASTLFRLCEHKMESLSYIQ